MNKYSKAAKANFVFLNPPALQWVSSNICDRLIPFSVVGDVHLCLNLDGRKKKASYVKKLID